MQLRFDTRAEEVVDGCIGHLRFNLKQTVTQTVSTVSSTEIIMHSTTVTVILIILRNPL